MSRYIDAEKLLKALDSYKGTEDMLFYDEIEMYVQDTPTADMQEVVRCKNCNKYVRIIGRDDCEIFGCSHFGITVKPNDFCSYGEQKGGAEQ